MPQERDHGQFCLQLPVEKHRGLNTACQMLCLPCLPWSRLIVDWTYDIFVQSEELSSASEIQQHYMGLMDLRREDSVTTRAYLNMT